MSKPVVLFFARGYQAEFFPTLITDRYDAVFVALRREERAAVEARGAKVVACFEDDFDKLDVTPAPSDYLLKSWPADRFLGRFDAKKRLEILGKEITFWRALLDRHKPAAVVNELVALEISEVLLTECRRADVLYLAGMNCVVDDLFYWLTDPMTLAGDRMRLPEPDANARRQAERYIDEVLAKDYKPFYVKNLAGRLALKPLLVGLAKWAVWQIRRVGDRHGAFRYEMYGEEYAKRIEVYFKGMAHRYDRLEDIPAGLEVIFYPLHQEPEATLVYMSEFYANQVATIENILRCLTPNQVLVVKEHPVDKGALLRSRFWKLRQDYSALYYLPAEIHGRQVLERATRVVTLTSTVGWEAAVIGKTAYVLGEIFYDNLDGLKRIRTLDELRQRLREPVPGPSVTRAEVVDFVARMAMASYPGNPFPHPGLYSDRNKQRVIHAICDAAGI